MEEVSSNAVRVTVSDATIASIKVSPTNTSIAEDLTQQLEAIATYTDGHSTDVTDKATWLSNDTKIATVDSSGFLRAINTGDTYITAKISEHSSEEVVFNVCEHLGYACIDVMDLGHNTDMLFTNSPSKLYLGSLEYDQHDGVFPDDTVERIIYTETDPETGDETVFETRSQFVIFSMANAQALCEQYRVLKMSGRENWRLPSLNELEVLFALNGSMDIARKWPVGSDYWSSDGNAFNLSDGNSGGVPYYVSCVSEP
jgi:hypothetical protein